MDAASINGSKSHLKPNITHQSHLNILLSVEMNISKSFPEEVLNLSHSNNTFLELQ